MKTTAPQGGALPAFLTVFLLVASVNHLGAQTLPSAWNNSDIGSPAAEGRASAAAGTFTIAGAGEVGGTADEFHFVYRRIAGDVDLAVKVNSLEDVGPSARAGVMIRDSLGASRRYAFLSVGATGGITFQRRPVAEGDTRSIDAGAGSAPLWLRLVRAGHEFAAYWSADGVLWTLIGKRRVSMPAAVYVGLAVASGRPARTATAIFSNLALRGGAALPEPWLVKDVGGIEAREVALLSDGFTISGAGTGLAETSDQFRFVYQKARGNIEIIARLTVLTTRTRQAEAGVTIRAALGKSARHATMLGTIASGWEFRRRVKGRETTHLTSGPPTRAPGWVRVVREGDLLSAYHSTDGIGWTLVDSDRISLPDEFYVGLAVASNTPFAAASATYDSVLVRQLAVANQPPAVSIVNPTAGERVAPWSSISIKANASDPDGVVTSVDFYRGSTLLGSDAAAPFSATWSGAASGAHTLSAVAHDNDGAATVASVSVVVGDTIPVGNSSLIFVPSADHTKNVSSYTLAIYRSSDQLTVTPLKSVNLGKPSPVAGEIEVDISPVIGTLGPGTYKAVVTAHNAAGSAASSPSPYFVK